MEDWPKSFLDIFESVATEIEQFFIVVTEDFNELVDELTKVSNNMVEELETTLVLELSDIVDFFLDPLSDLSDGLSQIAESDVTNFVSYVEPSATQNAVCRGCQHYHGQVYGGNLLVCGMHPYGVDTETCPDWESFS